MWPARLVVYRFGLASAALFLMCRLRGDRLRLPPWRAQRWMMLQLLRLSACSSSPTTPASTWYRRWWRAVLFALMVFDPLCARIGFGTPIAGRAWSRARRRSSA